MPSLLDRCPECGAPGAAGEICSTPDCHARGVRITSADEDPERPDGIVFDLGSLQAQFADIPDPEDEPMDPAQAPPPPPPPRKPYGRPESKPEPPPPPAPAPIQDDNWAANWRPPPPRREAEKTLLVEPIRDDEDEPIGAPKTRSSLLTIIIVLSVLFILVAVVWLMLNPPEPSARKGRSDVAQPAPVALIAARPPSG